MVKIVFLLLNFITLSAFAQIGGRTSFDFLNVPSTARLAALGGVNVSLADRDVNLFASNPSLTGDTLTGLASANYQFYVADIGNAFFSYAHPFSTLGTLYFGVQHVGYGSIQGYDASGLETSKFKSGETAFLITKNHQIANFRLGATLKGVFSSLAGVQASAMAFDLGGVFIHPQNRFTVGLTLKNIGFVLKDYSPESNSRLPFDVQLGATVKPEHMPLRFSFTAFNLTKPDVTYYNPAFDEEKPSTVKKVLSHLNVGAELLLPKNVTLMVAYNYLVHQALKLSNGGAGAGIAFGFSAQVKRFEFVFSRGGLVAGSAGYSFTLSTNVNKLLTRR